MKLKGKLSTLTVKKILFWKVNIIENLIECREEIIQNQSFVRYQIQEVMNECK